MYTASYISAALAYAVLYFLALPIGAIPFCKALGHLDYQGALIILEGEMRCTDVKSSQPKMLQVEKGRGRGTAQIS